MSTRALTIKENPDGSLIGVYNHSDGYVLGGVGETLYDHYQTPAKVQSLMGHGEVDQLGQSAEQSSFIGNPNPRWHDVKDLIQSIKDKHDGRVDTIFIEDIYLYSKTGSWRYFYDIDNGLHPKKTLYSAIRHDKSAEKKRQTAERRQAIYEKNMDALYGA